ncbi:IMS domain-containing protein/IMS_C domain-containing protein [Cephalotus follicularis]|uniref:DNA polymerase kappa n=1 Tax=Cephalotus follicularis TaxID=3775 RepID=A0A1Q3C0V6_CEPFO|nr:IMS domain-containing protein/IMS_C domain-containing protein [Cephalotus follicularis]
MRGIVKEREIEIERGIEMEKNENPRPWEAYHTAYTNAKAGMDGIDKEKVQRVVYDMSKGSKYFENEKRKEDLIKQRIENIRAQCAKLTAADVTHYQKLADRRILELEAARDLSRIWLHVDMDAFYAAVETLSNPSLKGKPVAVGSMSMISTANYEARRYGVRAAMPGFIACKLCPDLIFVPTDFKKYTYYSDLTRKVFEKYDPNFMAASLDEAYLDITHVCNERAITSAEISEELRTSIYEETGLTCSAGVAPNRLLAKVCSDINKPNGQFVLPNDRMAVMTFIASLPIRKIGGIGKVTEHILRDVFEINTCNEMLQKGGLLCAMFSHTTADFFLSVGLGLGRTDAPQFKFRKSMSSERTFSVTDDDALLCQKLAEIAEMLSAEMKKEGLCGRTLTLKLKTASFEVRTRAMTFQNHICSSQDILKYASKLLKAEYPVSLRLIGLRMSHLKEGKVGALSDPRQKTLSHFIMSGDALKNKGDCSSLSSEISYHIVNDTESDFSFDTRETYHSEFRDPLDSNYLPDLDDNSQTFGKSLGQMERILESFSDGTAEKVNAWNMAEFTHKKEQHEESQLLETESSSSGQLNRVNDEANMLNNDAIYSSNQLLFWVDDHKCSLCGIELPQSFVAERQEHFDFHLAERLQNEESGANSKKFKLNQRLITSDATTSQGKRKKHKPPPKDGGQIPIHAFFVKSNQNF